MHEFDVFESNLSMHNLQASGLHCMNLGVHKKKEKHADIINKWEWAGNFHVDGAEANDRVGIDWYNNK